MIEKIVNGKMEKFYEENCLYEQHFIKDEGVTISELVDQMIAKLGENISIRRYVRFKVGETGWRGDVRGPRPRLAGPTLKRRVPDAIRCSRAESFAVRLLLCCAEILSAV